MAKPCGWGLTVTTGRLVKVIKALVLCASALTLLCIAVASVLLSTWTAFPVSRIILGVADTEVTEKFVPASENSRLGKPDLLDRLLALPAIEILIAGLALLAVFYVWLLSFDKEAR